MWYSQHAKSSHSSRGRLWQTMANANDWQRGCVVTSGARGGHEQSRKMAVQKTHDTLLLPGVVEGNRRVTCAAAFARPCVGSGKKTFPFTAIFTMRSGPSTR